MAVYSLKRGLDIPISGAASGEPEALNPPKTIAYDPREFRGIVPRLAVKPGEKVKRGTTLFYAKDTPEMRFLSPAAGTVKEVQRGTRRVITAVVVDVDGLDSEAFPKWKADEIASKSRADITAALLSGGMWAALRTRPLNLTADPDVTPQAILICGTETGPCQPGADVLIDSDAKDAMQAGINALGPLTEGAVHLTTSAGANHPALTGLQGVSSHTFSGPHPAGDASVQINHVTPPKGGGQIWYISAWDVARIGQLLLTGEFPSERIYAAVGAGCEKPRFVKTLLGAPIADVLGGVKAGTNRFIRGSVLTGTVTDENQWCGFLAIAFMSFAGIQL